MTTISRLPTPAVAEPSRYRAVQHATARTCLDWHPFHAPDDDDPPFQGVTTVVNDVGDTVSIVEAAATDSTADAALSRLAWRRTGMWDTDPAGHRSAPVTRDPSWQADQLNPLDYPGRSLQRLTEPESKGASQSRTRWM